MPNFQKEYEESVEHWNGRAKRALVGLSIVEARYLTEEEVSNLGWSHSVLVMELSDGTLLFPSMDDEGNDGGSMFAQKAGNHTGFFPVIRNYAR
jgi:hypothetical protein